MKPTRHRVRLAFITAAALIVPLALYYLLLVQNRASALDQRNLRLLDAVGTELVARVELFPRIGEYAHAAHGARDSSGVQQRIARSIGASATEVFTRTTAPSECRKPPVRFVVDAPTSSLTVWLHTASKKACIEVRVPLRRLVDYEIPGNAFDAVGLADSSGRVLEINGRRESTVASLQGLLPRSGELDRPTPLALVATTHDSSDANVWSRRPVAEDVTISGRRYRLFTVPVPALSPCLQTSKTSSSSDLCLERAQGYAILGVVASSRFDMATKQVSPNVLATGGLSLILLLLSWPYLKVRFSSGREGIRVSDFIFLAVSATLGPALVAVALIDFSAYTLLSSVYDRTAADIAISAANGIAGDISRARDRLDRLVGQYGEAWKGEVCRATDLSTPESADACRKTTNDSREFKDIKGVSQLGMPELAFFARNSGCWHPPRVLWRERDLLPAPVADRTYFEMTRQKATRSRVCVGDLCSPRIGYVETIRSRDEGQKLTAIAAPIPPDKTTPCGPSVAAMTTRLSSIWNPILPPGFQLSVIEDRSGLVQHHSVDSRVLVETFFDEAIPDSPLRDAVTARAQTSISTRYRGEPFRMTTVSLGEPQWTVIAMRDERLLQLTNLQLLLTAFGHILVHLGVVAVFIVGVRAAGLRRFALEVAFPRPESAIAYRRSAWATGVLCVYYLIAALALNGALLGLVMFPSGILVLCHSAWLLRSSDVQALLNRQRTLLRGVWIVAVGLHVGWMAAAAQSGSRIQFALSVCEGILLGVAAIFALKRVYTNDVKVPSTSPMASLRGAFVANGVLIVLLIGPIPALAVFKDALRAQTIGIAREAQIEFSARIRSRAIAALADRERLDPTAERRRANPVIAFTDNARERIRLCDGQHGWRSLGVFAVWSGVPDAPPGNKLLCSSRTERMRTRRPTSERSVLSGEKSAESGLPPTRRWFEQPWVRTPFTSWLSAAAGGSQFLPTRRGATADAVEPLVDWRWEPAEMRFTGSDASALVHESAEGEPKAELRVRASNRLSASALMRDAFKHGSGADYIALTLSGLGLLALVWLTSTLVSWTARNVLGIDLSPFPAWKSLQSSDSSLHPFAVAARHQAAPLRGLLFIRADDEAIREKVAELSSRAGASGKPLEVDLRIAIEGKRGVWWPGLEELRSQGVLLLKHAETAIVDSKMRARLLLFLEGLLSKTDGIIVLQSEVSPLALVSERAIVDYSGKERVDHTELARWAAVLAQFWKERGTVLAPARLFAGGDDPTSVELRKIVWAECSWDQNLWPIGEVVLQQALSHSPTGLKGEVDRDQIVEVIRDRAEPFYRLAWSLCSLDEKRVLLRLAEGHLVHPRNSDILRGLLRRGLVVRSPAFQLVSSSFRRFVRNAESESTTRNWETDAEPTIWRDLRVALPLFFAVGWVLIFASSSESLEGLQVYIPVALGGAGFLSQVLGLLKSASAGGTVSGALGMASRSGPPTSQG